MNEKQINLVGLLMMQKISTYDFLAQYVVDSAPLNVYTEITKAIKDKDSESLECALYIWGIFESNKKGFNFDNESAEIFNMLLNENWHISHETIVGWIQYFKSPSSVDALYQSAITKFKYLDLDDEYYSYGVKCVWALAKIGTPEAIKKLELLARSEDKGVKEKAIKRLKELV